MINYYLIFRYKTRIWEYVPTNYLCLINLNFLCEIRKENSQTDCQPWLYFLTD